jgi:hypothetical protein
VWESTGREISDAPDAAPHLPGETARAQSADRN